MIAAQAKDRRFDQIAEGETAVLERVIGEAEVEGFAGLTGDRSPLHVDAAFAAGTRFGQRVAHGMILASLVSTLVGMELPGRHAVFLSQSTEFRKPVLLGDTVRLEARVARKIASTRILELDCRASNQRGELVMTGTARVMVTA